MARRKVRAHRRYGRGIAVELDGPALEVLLVVVMLHQRRRSLSIRDVMAITGHRSTNTVHEHLKFLRSRGFVDWEDGLAGTLRPLVHPVSVPSGHDFASDASAGD